MAVVADGQRGHAPGRAAEAAARPVGTGVPHPFFAGVAGIERLAARLGAIVEAAARLGAIVEAAARGGAIVEAAARRGAIVGAAARGGGGAPVGAGAALTDGRTFGFSCLCGCDSLWARQHWGQRHSARGPSARSARVSRQPNVELINV